MYCKNYWNIKEVPPPLQAVVWVTEKGHLGCNKYEPIDQELANVAEYAPGYHFFLSKLTSYYFNAAFYRHITC